MILYNIIKYYVIQVTSNKTVRLKNEKNIK